MGDLDRALSAYERALLHNPNSLPGLTQIAGIARIRENYTKVRRDVSLPTDVCRSFPDTFFFLFLHTSKLNLSPAPIHPDLSPFPFRLSSISSACSNSSKTTEKSGALLVRINVIGPLSRVPGKSTFSDIMYSQATAT